MKIEFLTQLGTQQQMQNSDSKGGSNPTPESKYAEKLLILFSREQGEKINGNINYSLVFNESSHQYLKGLTMIVEESYKYTDVATKKRFFEKGLRVLDKVAKDSNFSNAPKIDFSVQSNGDVILSAGENSYIIPKSFEKANKDHSKTDKDKLLNEVKQKVIDAFEGGLTNAELKTISEEAAESGIMVSKEKDGDVNISLGYSTVHIDKTNPKGKQ